MVTRASRAGTGRRPGNWLPLLTSAQQPRRPPGPARHHSWRASRRCAGE